MSLLLTGGLPNNHCAHTALWGECIQITARISFLTLYREGWSEALFYFSGGWADLLLLSRLLQPTQTCLLSCCSSASFQPPPPAPTSPLKKHPKAGPDTGVADPPRCLTAPAPRASRQLSRRGEAVLAAGQPRGRGAGRKSRLGLGGAARV